MTRGRVMSAMPRDHGNRNKGLSKAYVAREDRAETTEADDLVEHRESHEVNFVRDVIDVS